MTRKFIAATALTIMLTAPAYAFHCPADMKQIDAALESTQVSGADLDRVKELRAQGEAEHNAGNHAASVATLAEAKALLGLN
ncbi:MAG: hypothetical protein K8F25_12470 [Fimbriimonadaceae bacterium]|nr:hypothetical protein [Alphaproteobacteria bacterium]